MQNNDAGTFPTAGPHSDTRFGKPKSALLTIFDRQRRQALMWFLLAVAAWVWSAWDRRHLIQELTRKREVVLIDSLGTYYVSPVVDIAQAKDLHVAQTKLACKAMFERNPAGLDHPELLRQIFLKDAAKTAQAMIDKTKDEFSAKNLHQKVEVGIPEIISTRDQAFISSVDVQVIRVGSFQGAAITEAMRYKVRLKFLVNPDLTRNGRYPTAVTSFQIDPVKT